MFNRLLDQENKILVIIDLSEKEDEQAIFDTINSAGVRLSSADIIKNALFQKALDLFDSVGDVETLYKDNWENVFSLDEDAINFWDTPRATGRLMRDNIEILLHSISVIKGSAFIGDIPIPPSPILICYICIFALTGLFINRVSSSSCG